MRAIVCTEYGTPDTLSLQDIADPVPGPDQVLVRIHAAGVNFVDSLLISGRYQIKIPPPFVPGGDLAGTVLEVGSAVTAFAPGDRVLASPGIGAFAQRIALPAASLVKIPDTMDFAAAAVFLQAHATAWFALHDRGSARRNETLLVLGAAGGTGGAAIQVAKAAGLKVIAAASSPEKLAACGELGADFLIDYAQQDLRAELKRITAGRGVDLVFDPVGGAHALLALRSMAENGRYLVIGFASGEIPSLPFNLPLLKSCQVVGVDWGGFAGRHPQRADGIVREVLALSATGLIREPPITRYALERTGEAIGELAARRAIGKCVIEIG
ncbi:MAG: NADPH:quinone oxidoreductase family protein [Gammaproteobacteria bacterium]|nr:NADPH:quinone oxidoreductase family protein [Gammaproteobacteria bacterium]